MADAIILAGGGGHCKSCIEVIEANGKFEIKGILDDQLSAGSQIMGYLVLGGDDLIASLAMENNYFLITVGQIESPAIRIRIAHKILHANGFPATVVAAGASVSRSSSLGEGTIVMQHVIVNGNSRIGQHAILNNKCLVEHDTVVGDFCHISTGAIVNGNCLIGDRVFIGSGAVLTNGVSIAPDVVIGAGSVVIHSINEPGVYAGNPARKISKSS